MRNLLFIAFVLFTIDLYAQKTATIQGKVTDKESGEVLLYTNVTIHKNGKVITGGQTDFDGNYSIKKLDPGTYDVEASYVGYTTTRIENIKVLAGKTITVNIEMTTEGVITQEVVVTAYRVPLIEQDNTTQGRTITRADVKKLSSKKRGKSTNKQLNFRGSRSNASDYYVDGQRVRGKMQKTKQKRPFNTEEYAPIVENDFHRVRKEPLSTFSVDVDNAAYSNVRRFLKSNQMPEKSAVRIEEMVNYFTYDYENPRGKDPFSVNTELGQCPWNQDNLLLHIGLQGRKVDLEQMPPNNLVFLLDVSGSMSSDNKLPLLKKAFQLLVENMRAKDKISIVVYAGAAGLVLPPTSGNDKATILAALNKLESGGSTAGGAGIELAYKTALENYLKKGNNRVILATDGDFNVGVSSTGSLAELIEEKRNDGVYLTVLGFGMGNYKDNRLETLADKGNGNYAYIDNIKEAEKVLVSEMGGTLLTIAKDVKLQLEFNPAEVHSYRLIGYENRLLNKEDFKNDKKDAGEIGAGHTVTALYEIVPARKKTKKQQSDLKYQELVVKSDAKTNNELVWVKLRYKQPDKNKSIPTETIVKNQIAKVTSNNFNFSAAVAGFGMLLRDSKHKGKLTYSEVMDLAILGQGKDEKGYRAEFLELVKLAESISSTTSSR